MHIETMVFVGWIAAPGLAYVGGRMMISRVTHGSAVKRAFDARARLEELRRRHASGQWVMRGRMSEALLLAEEATLVAPVRSPQAEPGPLRP